MKTERKAFTPNPRITAISTKRSTRRLLERSRRSNPSFMTVPPRPEACPARRARRSPSRKKEKYKSAPQSAMVCTMSNSPYVSQIGALRLHRGKQGPAFSARVRQGSPRILCIRPSSKSAVSSMDGTSRSGASGGAKWRWRVRGRGGRARPRERESGSVCPCHRCSRATLRQAMQSVKTQTMELSTQSIATTLILLAEPRDRVNSACAASTQTPIRSI